MSTRYEASLRSAAAPAAGAAWIELRNLSATRRVYIEELACTLNVATASPIAIVRANAQGSGGAVTGTGQPSDPNDAASVGITLAAAAFGTAPTFTIANAMRRFGIGAAVGAGFHWVWPQSSPLTLAPSASLVVVAIAIPAATADWFAVWSE